jgi:hypothetical protein
MFLSKTFFKTNSMKRVIYTQCTQYRGYVQVCHNTYKEPHCCNLHPNFNKPCCIDHKRNIIRCRFDVNGCRCQCYPYGIDRIIYYINPVIQNRRNQESQEITC